MVRLNSGELSGEHIVSVSLFACNSLFWPFASWGSFCETWSPMLKLKCYGLCFVIPGTEEGETRTRCVWQTVCFLLATSCRTESTHACPALHRWPRRSPPPPPTPPRTLAPETGTSCQCVAPLSVCCGWLALVLLDVLSFEAQLT